MKKNKFLSKILAVALTASLFCFTSCADKLMDEAERISSMITESIQGEQTTYVQRTYRICPQDQNGQLADGLYGTNVLDTLIQLLNSAKFFECLMQKTNVHASTALYAEILDELPSQMKFSYETEAPGALLTVGVADSWQHAEIILLVLDDAIVEFVSRHMMVPENYVKTSVVRLP